MLDPPLQIDFFQNKSEAGTVSPHPRSGRYYRKNIDIEKIIGIEKNIFGNYRYQKMCLQFHLINSIESTVPKTRKRVFHILDEYEIVFENSAQSCAAILAEHLGL